MQIPTETMLSHTYKNIATLSSHHVIHGNALLLRSMYVCKYYYRDITFIVVMRSIHYTLYDVYSVRIKTLTQAILDQCYVV